MSEEVSEEQLVPIPEPAGKRPFGGHAHLLDLAAPLQSMAALADELGPIYQLAFAGGAELIVISSQELVAEVCDETRFDKKVSGALYNIRDFVYDGLFTAHTTEDNWQRAHQLLAPAFGMGSMQNYFPKMLEVSQQICQRWARLNHSDEIDVPDEMVRLTLEVIGLCGFDYRFDSFGREQTHPFVQSMGFALSEAMARAVRIPILSKLALSRNRTYDDAIKYMNSVVDTVISERKSSGRVGEVGDLLDLMLASQADAKMGLSDENIRYQIITFLIAGHETTSGLLAFVLCDLVKHPAVMSRARAEVDRVLGHDLERDPTLRDVAGLAYLRQVLNESLRLYPTAPALQMMPYETTTLAGKYRVLARRPILVLTSKLHRDKHVWGENAHLFNPENFAPAREKSRPPHSFKPFGNGQRACIGSQFALQEATLVLGMLLQRFNLIDHTNYQLRIQETLTFKPADFRLQVRARSEADREALEEETGRQLTSAMPQPMTLRPDHATPLTIAYGSNMGSARQIAQRLADEGSAQGYLVSLTTLDERVAELPSTGLLFVVCASYTGQPPDNARGFFAWLEALAEDDTQDLDALWFAVLGVGNRDWAATYQRVPRLLDEWLARAGAQRLLERGEADARSDFFGQVDDYALELWSSAADQFHLRDAAGGAVGPFAASVGSRYRVDLLQHTASAVGVSRFPDTQVMEVIENIELSAPDNPYGGAKHHIGLRLPSAGTYKTGDHLLVMPQNRTSLVERVATRFGLALAQRLAIVRNSTTITAGNTAADPLPVDQELSVAELLMHYIELQDPLTQRQLTRLCEHVGCPNRLEVMQTLAADAKRFAEQISEPRVSLLQYLEDALECELPFEVFLELVAPMRPRYYSISSSALCEPRSVDLTLSVLRDATFEGACSVYLQNCSAGDGVTARVRSVESHFLPPTDLATPMIMIGPGTGIAPFRGFVQDRHWLARSGATLGPAMLFFGCRHPDIDFLYQEELERAHKDGVIELSVAFSRLKDEPDMQSGYHQIRGYVQDALEQQHARVWQLLNAGALIYVCGDAAHMLAAVRAQFESLYLRYNSENPDDPEAAAKRWLVELEGEARFLVDAWS